MPITEYDTINYGLAVERTDIETFSDSPQQYVKFVEDFGNTNTALIGHCGLGTRRSRQRDLSPPAARCSNANFEVAMPPGELRYYRATYRVD